jgi:hypothetical protein
MGGVDQDISSEAWRGVLACPPLTQQGSEISAVDGSTPVEIHGRSGLAPRTQKHAEIGPTHFSIAVEIAGTVGKRGGGKKTTAESGRKQAGSGH